MCPSFLLVPFTTTMDNDVGFLYEIGMTNGGGVQFR